MMKNNERLLLGGSIALLSWFSVATTNALVKLVSEVTPAQILLCQNIFGLLVILCISFAKGEGVSIFKAKCWGLLFIRSFSGLAAWFLVFISLAHVSVADATLLLNTGPLFVPFLMLLCFQEPIKKRLWLGIIPGFIGIVLILKPGSELFHWHVLMPLLSGVCVATIMIVLRRLYEQGEPALRILLYLFLFAFLITLPFGIAEWKHLNAHEWFYVFLTCVAGFFAQTAITYAMRYGSAKAFAPLCYSSVIFGLLYDRLIWHTLPTWMSFCGMALVIIGGITALYIASSNSHEA